MELEELEAAYRAQSQNLDSALRLNERAIRMFTAGRVQTGLRRLRWGLAWELALNVIAAGLLGAFIYGNWGAWRFVVPAATLDLGAIALISSAIRQLAGLSGVDFGGPVPEIQARLASLRVQRIQTNFAILALATVAWVPLLIVALKGFLGIDVYAIFSAAWIASNIAFGLVVLGVGIYAARRWGSQVDSTSWVRAFADLLAGRSLARAREQLVSVTMFTAE